MRKIIVFFLSVIILTTFASCTGDNAANKLDSDLSATNEEPAAISEQDAEVKEADIDLTDVNSTMVYSQLTNMTLQPSEYVGKTVRISGTMNILEGSNKTYYLCMIKDATLCCAQGLEFVLDDGSEYPESGSDITVYGVFDTYLFGDNTNCRLIYAELEETE